jgi:hypothetical protein
MPIATSASATRAYSGGAGPLHQRRTADHAASGLPAQRRDRRCLRLTTTLGFLFDTSTAALRLILGGLFVRHPDFKLYLVHVGSLLPYILGRLDYEAARYKGAMGSLDVSPSEHVNLLYTDSVCVYPPALRSRSRCSVNAA